MLYTGTYGGYLLQVVSSDVKIRFTICDSTSQDGSSITTAHLNTTSARMFSKFILASFISDRSLNIISYAGSMYTIREVLDALSGSQFLKSVTTSKDYVGSEVIGGISLSIDACNAYIESTSKISGLEYVSTSKKKVREQLSNTDSEFRGIQMALLKNRVKTFEEIKSAGIYDLSWLYNPDGTEKKDYRIINTMEGIDWIIEEISKPDVDVVSIDTEFTNMNVFWQHPNRARLISMSLSWREDQGVSIPFENVNFAVLDIHKVMDKLYPVLKTKKLASHNGIAEIKILYSYGYLIEIAYDTLMLEFNLDPTVSRGSKALKTITRRIFGHETMELSDIMDGDVHGELLIYADYDTTRIYGCSDSDYCLKVLNHELKQLPRTSYAPFALDNRITQMIAMAEFYGAKINMRLLQVMSRINEYDLKRVEDLCYKFIHEYGLRYQASLELVEQDINVTDDKIEELINDRDFLARVNTVLYKNTKRDGLTDLKLSSNKDLKQIFFKVLGYPVMRVNDNGEPSITDAAIKDWMSKPPVDPVKFLKGDVVSVGYDLAVNHADKYPELEWIKYNSPKDNILVSKAKFESTAYPFAYLLAQWRSLFKLQTSFYNRLLSAQSNGWYYSETSMTSAETARVVNNIQTLKGSLRRLIVPFSDDYYMIVFDYDQIEFRVMIGIANEAWKILCNKLLNSGDPDQERLGTELSRFRLDDLVQNLSVPDRDYHREGGSKLLKTTPDKMTPEQRKKIKPVHFSVPYGAEAYSIAGERMRMAKTPEEKQEILDDTEALLASWRKGMFPLAQYLSYARAQSLTPVPDSELPEHLKGRKMGRVYNQFGRFRWFDLSYRNPKPEEVKKLCAQAGIDIGAAYGILKSKIARVSEGSIRRAGGNYPIQSLAREIFFDGMNKLYNRLKREGYISDNPDELKVVMSLFIHDESNIQVHKSIHPFKMYKMIYEESLQRFKGHPYYFMGIAVVNNWLEGKEDKFGASIRFVEYCIKQYDANPEYYDREAYHITNHKEYILRHMAEHFCKRVIQDTVKQLIEYIAVHGFVDWLGFFDEFKDYYIKQRLKEYCYTLRETSGPEDKMGAFVEYCYLRYASDKILSKIIVQQDNKTVNLLDLRSDSEIRRKLVGIIKSEDTYVSYERSEISSSGISSSECFGGNRTFIPGLSTIPSTGNAFELFDEQFIDTNQTDASSSMNDITTGSEVASVGLEDMDLDAISSMDDLGSMDELSELDAEFNFADIENHKALNSNAEIGSNFSDVDLEDYPDLGFDDLNDLNDFDDKPSVEGKDNRWRYVEVLDDTELGNLPSLASDDQTNLFTDESSINSVTEVMSATGEIQGELTPEVGATDAEDDLLDLDSFEFEEDDVVDMRELCNAVVNSYIDDAEEITPEVQESIRKFKERVVIGFMGSVTIDCIGCSNDNIIKVIQYLSKYRNAFGSKVRLQISPSLCKELGYKIACDFPKDDVNKILSGVEL